VGDHRVVRPGCHQTQHATLTLSEARERLVRRRPLSEEAHHPGRDTAGEQRFPAADGDDRAGEVFGIGVLEHTTQCQPLVFADALPDQPRSADLE